MPGITVINQLSEIPVGWKDCDKFKSQGRIVDEKGREVTAEYCGNRYEIISKKVRIELVKDHTAKKMLVIAFALSALFVYVFRNIYSVVMGPLLVSPFYFTSKPPLPKETHVRFAILRQTGEDYAKEFNKKRVERELQEGIDFTAPEIEHLAREIEKFDLSAHQAEYLRCEVKPGITLYGAQGVFTADKVAGLIFKPDPEGKRFEKMIAAKIALEVDRLSLLVIPQAKPLTLKINGSEVRYVAEKMLDIEQEPSMQEELFEKHAFSLTEAIKQLALFICKTGYSDVDYRNNPVLENSLDSLGRRKIALIDLEHVEKPHIGLFGGGPNFRKGLVAIVSSDQGRMVAEIARQHNVDTDSFEYIHFQRRLQIAANREYKSIYAARNIVRGDEQLQCNLEELSFPSKLEKIGLFREIAKTLIEEINRQISETRRSTRSLIGKRRVCIDLQKSPFLEWTHIPQTPDKVYVSERERATNSPLGKVIEALVDRKIILAIHSYNSLRTFLQV